jgi:hypothetical protein
MPGLVTPLGGDVQYAINSPGCTLPPSSRAMLDDGGNAFFREQIRRPETAAGRRR